MKEKRYIQNDLIYNNDILINTLNFIIIFSIKKDPFSNQFVFLDIAYFL